MHGNWTGDWMNYLKYPNIANNDSVTQNEEII
jgi:hypothetical protein